MRVILGPLASMVTSEPGTEQMDRVDGFRGPPRAWVSSSSVLRYNLVLELFQRDSVTGPVCFVSPALLS